MGTIQGVLLGVVLSAAAGAPPASTVDATFTFGIGSSDLDATMRDQLDAIAAELRRSPRRLVVEGHADSAGPAEVRESVSRERAERVASALQRRGVPASQLEVKWLAATAPLDSNATDAGRARNRRVELRAVGAPVVARVAPAPKPEPAPAREAAPVAKVEPAPKPEPTPAREAAPVAKVEPAPKPEPTPAREAAPVAKVEPAPQPEPTHVASTSDVPRREPAPRLTPSAPVATVDLATKPAPSRTRFWVATGTTALAVASGVTALALLADSASAQQGLATANTQLARPDLVPQSRTAWDTHAAALQSAVQSDQLGAGVFGAVAVAAGVTAAVLWVQELAASN